jgi:hypothetical protein
VQHIIAQAGRQAPPEQIERHLWSCPACSQVYLEQQALWREMDAWEAPEVSAGFDRRLFARIGRRLTEPWLALDWMTRLFRPLQPALPAAVACMLLLAAVVVQKGRYLGDVGEPTVAAQTVEELRQIDVALDDIQMLSEFEILPVEGAGEGKS